MMAAVGWVVAWAAEGLVDGLEAQVVKVGTAVAAATAVPAALAAEMEVDAALHSHPIHCSRGTPLDRTSLCGTIPRTPG